jgi:chromosome transmission fidelity protein 4
MSRIIPSYPHAQGTTKLAYSLDGKYLITAGADQLIRKFSVDEDREPETFEDHSEGVVAVAASENGFASGSEDCTVNLFKAAAKSGDPARLVTRCTLPVRDVAFSPDGEWLGVASEYTYRGSE